jgi:hypothetical protein
MHLSEDLVKLPETLFKTTIWRLRFAISFGVDVEMLENSAGSLTPYSQNTVGR